MFKKILIIICTQVLIIHGERGSYHVPCEGKEKYVNETDYESRLSYAEACKVFNCVNGYVTKDCIAFLITDSTYASSPPTVFYEIGEYLYFMFSLPIYDKLYTSQYANLTYVHLTLDPKRNDVVLFSPTITQPLVEFQTIDFISTIRFRGRIHFNETLLPLIHGAIEPLSFTFSVGRHHDVVQRSVNIGLVQKRCEHEGVIAASPGTLAEVPCNQTKYPNATSDPDNVLLRYCNKYGWDDSRTQDFCDPLRDRAVYLVQTDDSNATEVFILLVVVISLVVFAVMICYFVYKTYEEWDDSDSSVDCGKNVDAEDSSFAKSDAHSDAETSDDGKEDEEEEEEEAEEPGKEGASKKTAIQKTSNDTATGSYYSGRAEGKLKREPGQCKDKREPSLKIESSIPGTDPGEYKPKSIVHELAMLAKLRDVGDVTAEEFGLVKNMILFE